jgi:hypothetical protein
MKKQAEQIVGEPLLDGVLLVASGSYQVYRKRVWRIFGVVGFVAAKVANKKTDEIMPGPHPMRRDQDCGAYLGHTTNTLFLVRSEEGLARHHLHEQIARFAPGDLDRFEFGRLATAVGALTIVSNAGERWCYEFSKRDRKKLIAMAEACGVAVVRPD